MRWLLLAAVVSCVSFVWIFFNSNLFGRNRTRRDFEQAVRSLLALMQDGGVLRVKQRQSPVWIEVARESGSVPDAGNLILRVPHARWSIKHSEPLKGVLASHGYDASFDENAKTLCEVRIPVEDIWKPWAGAVGARLLNLVLDSLSVRTDARFDLSLVGRRSRRLLERERELRAAEQE